MKGETQNELKEQKKKKKSYLYSWGSFPIPGIIFKIWVKKNKTATKPYNIPFPIIWANTFLGGKTPLSESVSPPPGKKKKGSPKIKNVIFFRNFKPKKIFWKIWWGALENFWMVPPQFNMGIPRQSENGKQGF